MADPVTMTMAGISMAASAGGGILGFLGAKEQGAAEQQMYQYKAAVAQQNQKIAAQNAQNAIVMGGNQAMFSGLKAAQQMGVITAEQAASGIALTGGSAADVRKGQLMGAQTEEAQLRSEAAWRAHGFEVEGLTQQEAATMDIMSGQTAKTAAGYQEAGSLLGGASSVADKWMKFSQQGVPGFSSNPFSNVFGSAKPFTGL
jgi:hypothetical protein